jgi:hypothetical protein
MLWYLCMWSVSIAPLHVALAADDDHVDAFAHLAHLVHIARLDGLSAILTLSGDQVV